MVVEYKVKPWAHQLEAIERAKSLPYFGLFFEVGAGKTLAQINILRHKFVKEKRVLRTIILGPPIVVQNWRREFAMHSKVGDFVHCLEGTGKERAKYFQKHAYHEKGAKEGIFITNYESLLMRDLFQMFLDWKPEAVVFDESHRLKNVKAKRTKLAVQLADLARYRYIMTGTPILNSMLDVFAQIRLLDGGATFGKNFFVFRANYFHDKNAFMPRDKYFPAWVPNDDAAGGITAKIAPFTMAVKKADCLDLPPLVRQTVMVKLSKEQARLYQSMKEDFIAYVGDAACVASLAIVKALRLQQIVSGFLTLSEEGEDQRNAQIKDNPRAEALEELLSDITPNSKCLVWAVFRENYATVRAVCDALKIKYVEVHGGISAAQRQKNVDAFNMDETIRVLIGHPASAGIGINLVCASYSIFYSRSFSLGDDLQAEARNYRGGSEMHDKVTRIDLVAEGTIDELILEKLASKCEIGDKILRDIATRI